MDKEGFARRFWEKKWRDWHRKFPKEIAVPNKVMATWRDELRATIKNLKKGKQ
jgi:hypothetical protein